MKKAASFLILLIFALVLSFGSLSYQISLDALTIWFEKLVPSMITVMVLVKVLFEQGILQWIAKPIGFLFAPVFHIEADSFAYVIAAIFLGFPAGASFLNQEVEAHHISKKEGQRLIYTCSFATPGFVIMSCGAVLFQSTWIGLQLFFIQILTGLLLLFFTRKTWIHGSFSHHDAPSLMISLKAAIQESGITLYMIGGYLMLFMSVAAILVQFVPESMQMPLRILSEFSSGTVLLSTLPYTRFAILVMCCMLLSFGGFCVHMQVMSMAKNTHLRYFSYLGYRILQALLSGFLAYLIFLPH